MQFSSRSLVLHVLSATEPYWSGATPQHAHGAECVRMATALSTRQSLPAITPEAVLAGKAASAATGAAKHGSQANGALMRVSPLGIWGADQPAEVVADAARQDARLTHPHPVCAESSAMYAATIAHAISQGRVVSAPSQRS